MILKNFKHLLFVTALLSLPAINAYAQTPDASLLWIVVDDHQGNSFPMYFGNNVNATYCIDDGTNGSTQLFESIAPPAPPSGFDTRWKGVRTTAGNACIVDGLFPRDMRSIPTNPAKRDTFSLNFYNTDIPDSSMYFSWDASRIASHCDSCFFQYLDPDSSPTTIRVNMIANSSWVIPNAVSSDGLRNITNARIYKFGTGVMIDGVNPTTEVKPTQFGIKPNYPNPFNPSTTITFDIQKSATADISIFNVLGQKIATLVTANYAQGEYTTVWNGTNQNGVAVPSGVYFARMSARAEQTGEVFTGLRKLLLMK